MSTPIDADALIDDVQPLNFLDFISVDGDKLVTNSLKVAAAHKKRHDNVLRIIRKRIKDAGSWGVLNFEETPYIDAQSGLTQPMFTITRNGYAFLVGRLTGKLAAKHYIAYIEAFDAMERYIKNQRDGLRYQCMQKELECRDSAHRGSYHGRGLNQRKQEKPVLESELSTLQAQAQASLIPATLDNTAPVKKDAP